MRGIGGRDVGSGREGEREYFQSSETLCVSRPSLVTPPFRLVSYSSSLSLSLSLTHSLTNKRSETTKFTLHYISFSLSLSIHRSGTRLPTTQLSFSNQWQTVIQKHYYQSTSVLKYKCFKVSKILETLGTQKQQQKMRHEMI